jgi:hypothetical protein
MASVRKFKLAPAAFSETKVRGQAAIIVAAMSETEPKSVKEIIEGLKVEDLKTRQDPERVVGYYMTVWKKDGKVLAVEAEAPAGEAEQPEEAEDEEEGDAEIDAEDAASTGATEEQRMEAAAEADLEATSIQIDKNMKVGEAVLAVMQSSGQVAVEDIVTLLDGFQYQVEAKQVRGALSNLIRRGVVIEAAQGRYEARG